MRFIFFLFFISVSFNSISQNKTADSMHIDYRAVYSFCLDANVKPALNILFGLDKSRLSEKDKLFKSDFEKRFAFPDDRLKYPERAANSVLALLKIYRDYWRASLLDSAADYDSLFTEQLTDFLNIYIVPSGKLRDTSVTIDSYLKEFIKSKGYYSTGFGKTGRLFDLLIWKKEQDTTYMFTNGSEKTRSRVIFMDEFLTLGWEQYATLGRYYPGGWATDTALYCVKQAYDLNSEDFLISYLAHESRHFADYKLFPNLKSADLEYRAKLTELSMADSRLYSLIEFFITNGNYESENAHSLADYCVIRDLSMLLFKKKFERDMNVWEKTGVPAIHAAAKKQLIINSKALHALGANTGGEIYIRNHF